MSRLQIFVSGITSLTDARYCAGMGVPYLSVCFDPEGKTELDSTSFQAIRAWIEGVEWWGEYAGSDPVVLFSLQEAYVFSGWIVSPDLAEKLSDAPFQKRVSLEKDSQVLPEFRNVELEISGPKKEVLAEWLQQGHNVLLKNPEDAHQILALHRAFPELIFKLLSGAEERPGWMDLSGLQDVLEELEQEGFGL
jgi:phosphoribosylanthranilate isomerase